MKNIFYKIFPVCLLLASLAGCSDETKYLPLEKPVPLTMSVNEKVFVMGERLVVDLAVNPDAEGNEVPANEDFDIYFTAKSGTDDASGIFKDFHRIVTFPKGETKIRVEFPFKETGLDGSLSFEFAGFVRGYKLANSNQVIKVSDFYRVSMSLENNADNVVTEGDKFVLVAKIDKPVSVPIDVTVTPKEGEEDYYENLPSTLTIPAGSTTIRSGSVTIKPDGKMTGDLNLVLNFESSSSSNPMLVSSLTIKMTDLESLADPDLYDPTKVYVLPEQMFYSAMDSWLDGKSIFAMSSNNPHPTAEIASAGWKFDYAVEFHNIARCYTVKTYGNAVPPTSHHVPNGFSDANEAAAQKVHVVDNAKYSNVNENGELVMWAGIESGSKPYGASALQCCKVGGNLFALNFSRIYPGMRVELRARLRGNRTGFVPTIELKDHSIMSNGAAKSISILKNSKGNVVTQSVTGTTVGDALSKNSTIPTANEYNIYWVELVDENTINLGINGVTTLTVTKDDLATWPYTKAAMDNSNASMGCKGLFMVMRMAPAPEVENNTMPAGWDTYLKTIDPANYEKEAPRIEVDWIRFYTNSNYNRTDGEKLNRNNLFY